jgi:hypothetical protein
MYLDDGHDMSEVAFVLMASTMKELQATCHKAMGQLGFKRSDYGAIHTEWLPLS